MRLLTPVLLVLAIANAGAQIVPQFLRPSCQRLLYCNSKLLHYVQMARVFPDSKTFVDLSLKYNEDIIFESFNRLLKETQNNPTKAQLTEFVNLNFNSTDELEEWTPKDFKKNPEFLNSITDGEFKQFAKDIHNLWPSLGRKIKSSVYQQPELSSLIPLPYGFMIPGGKFRELYYWDSYWIIRGLLVSGMHDTVKGIIGNLIYMQKQFGHVPNGGRYYYQERSQPPLLAAMMALYVEFSDDIDFMKKNLHVIEDELEYWLDTHSVAFTKNGTEYTLLRYFSPSEGPRPEAYYEDFSEAEDFDSDDRRDQFYVDIKSAAESGWDFSTRWFINQEGPSKGNLSAIHVTDIVPVDLNAIFTNALLNLEEFYKKLENPRKGAHWGYLAKQWMSSMQEVLWHEEDGIWYDYDLLNERHRNYFYLSNIAPLSMSAVHPDFVSAKAHRILEYLNNTQTLDLPGGIPTSLFFSGEQWDYPNAWPPLMSMTVSALEVLNTPEADQIAFQVSQNWIRSAYIGYVKNNRIYKKYHVQVAGKSGLGGDFVPQRGYGWSNGVILEMLYKYGSTLKASDVMGAAPLHPEFLVPAPEEISVYYKK
ncbi:trehalase-like [Aricia agestis]|uniref:trehalase-like n=1 Tax=Aricia agestis TaxID=91739 RepID=UPI001C20AC60|nr:trehalase-like [Aricia agestis]